MRGRRALSIAVAASVASVLPGCDRDHAESPPVSQPPTAPAATGGVRSHAAAPSGPCGVERWDVKTGTDDAAASVDFGAAVAARIDSLRRLPAPALLDVRTPRGAEERVARDLHDVRLVCVKREDDRDEHLVVEERDDPVVEPSEDHGCKQLHEAPSLRTVVVEVPDPACLSEGHPWRERIAAVRALVDRETHPEARARRVNRIVSLRGVTFFDVVHGQLGVAPNGVELHPVLAMCFGEACSLSL